MRKLAIGLAVASCVTLLAMVIVSIVTGATQEAHEHIAVPDVYAANLLAHADGLRLVMALDVAFLVLYTAFFATLPGYLRAIGQPRVLVTIALGAMIAVALRDMLEDHYMLALLAQAEHGIAPTSGAIAYQTTESATKFSISYLALMVFGLAVPRTTRIGLVLALFLTVGTLVAAVAGLAVSPSAQASIDSGRWVGFLIGFALAIAWLVRQRDAEPDVRAGA